MTDQDFENWYADYCRSFPGTLEWLNSLGGDFKTAQKRNWATALAGIELRDARAATLRMAVGDAPAVNGYERELTGAAIRRVASELAAERATVAIERNRKRELYADGPAKGDGISLGGLYREIIGVLDKGGTQADALAIVNAKFPPRDEQRGRRYRCARCLDTKVIYVWSGVSVKAVLDGKIGERRFRKAACSDCECARSARERNPDPRKERSTPRWVYFDAGRHCICPMGEVDDPENIATLEAWVARKNSAEGCANYSTAIAGFIQGDVWEGDA